MRSSINERSEPKQGSQQLTCTCRYQVAQHDPGNGHCAKNQLEGAAAAAGAPCTCVMTPENPYSATSAAKKAGLVVGNVKDAQGRPAGGSVEGAGLSIRWQNGPLSVDGQRLPPNGAFVENVILAAASRLEHYQTSPYATAYNDIALQHLRAAIEALQRRTREREARGVEGTYGV